MRALDKSKLRISIGIIIVIAIILFVCGLIFLGGADAELDFNIANYWTGEVFGLPVWITETMVNTWIIMGVLILFAIVVRVKLNSFTEVPKGFQNVIEGIVELFDG